ncbi:MAG: triose-phosphate isomerase [Microthrixaceae bacterium]
MARKPIISGNWKMHHNHFEAIQAVQKLHYRLDGEDHSNVDVSVHPPFTDIRSIQTVIESDKMKILIGAQNCHWEPKGAYTGEVAAPMLEKLNVTHVIVGHSERRQYFGETDEIVNLKAKAVLGNGMTPIVCCGETLEEREAGQAESKVESQIRNGLAGVTKEHVASLVIAYEPIWAIGTGRTATSEDAQSMCAHIRSVVADAFGSDVAESVRIQYGGSVKPGNIAELMAQPDIDGALVGGASLDPDEFAAIVQFRNH